MPCDCVECRRFKEAAEAGQPFVVPSADTFETAPEPDPVNHPAHYTAGKIEVIDFIEDQKLPYHLGNVVKYVARSPHKGAQLQDLKKARWYLDRYISNLEKAQP